MGPNLDERNLPPRLLGRRNEGRFMRDRNRGAL